MDTEFPGVVYCPNTGKTHQLDPFNHYRILKANVDALKVIQLLKQQGIDFTKNREKGICAASSYDFAYLIKILTQSELPSELPAFLSLVEFFFGMRVYDMKHIVRYCDGLYSCLERIAKTLQVDRVAGKSHQAGLDSLLTLQTIMKLKDRYFNGRIGHDKFGGVLFGLQVTKRLLQKQAQDSSVSVSNSLGSCANIDASNTLSSRDARIYMLKPTG
ncbi:hypothetical protein HHK36_025961 [Tetracentron sinense]|uniref:Uncharacterized protein n=1 Tax=Tetracentron sinense TaxID=13715 RepID=A0A835D3I7_TETSI|nr:hypothetical protein HHK36_025961 [Tetracentron sinense]